MNGAKERNSAQLVLSCSSCSVSTQMHCMKGEAVPCFLTCSSTRGTKEVWFSRPGYPIVILGGPKAHNAAFRTDFYCLCSLPGHNSSGRWKSLQKGIENVQYRKTNKLCAQIYCINCIRAQSKMTCLSLFPQERRLKPDIRQSFEIQRPMQMSHPTVEALFYYFASTVFCWSRWSCPGQHTGNVTCNSCCVTVRILPFWLEGGWSHQADLTWLKIITNSLFSSFFYLFLLSFPSYLTQRKTPDRWSICGSSLFFFLFFSFWQKSLVLLPQLLS